MDKAKTLTGKCEFYSETGTEGGYWAFQDSRFIKPNTTQFVCKKCYVVWDKKRSPNGPAPIVEGALSVDKIILITKETIKKNYKLPRKCRPNKHEFELSPNEFEEYEGLHILKDGDYLFINSPKEPDKIVWEGIISLHQYPAFKKAVFGCWMHADQNGVDRKKWAEYFFKEYPAKLIKKESL